MADEVQPNHTMKLLYTAYALEKVSEDGGKYLLPGFPTGPNTRQIVPNETVRLELADGTVFETKAIRGAYVHLDDSFEMTKRLHQKTGGFHTLVVVPEDLDIPAIELGVKVYVE